MSCGGGRKSTGWPRPASAAARGLPWWWRAFTRRDGVWRGRAIGTFDSVHCRLFKTGGHQPRAASSMQNCDNPQGIFVRRVGDQVLANQKKPKGPLGEVRTFVALSWKRRCGRNGRYDFRDHAVGCVQVIRTNELPNLVEVRTGLRMEGIPDHEPGCERRAAALLSRK